MAKYIYPHLGAVKTGSFIRYAGSGLANTLFVYSRALLLAERYGLKMIQPTWFNFDPVQWKQWSRDKRTYLGIFQSVGVSGLKKWFLLSFKKKISEEDFLNNGADTDADYVEVYWMKTFQEILSDSQLVKKKVLESLQTKVLVQLDGVDFSKKIAVHIRLGDYSSKNRIPIEWYRNLVVQIHDRLPDYEFLVFSEGSDSELKDIISLPYVKRVFFGNAMADIFGISRCEALIGSFSTFSDWGGYFGQIPSILRKKPHYGSFLEDLKKEFIVGDGEMIPQEFFDYFV